MENTELSPIYSKQAIEFVAVADEMCRFLENAEEQDADSIINTLKVICPLLYLKACTLPSLEEQMEEPMSKVVSEFDYQNVRLAVAASLDSLDDFLELLDDNVEDEHEPVTCYISEYCADIYQELKDFTANYSTGLDEVMNDALFECKQSFEQYWGQKLVNIMHIVHSISYKKEDEY